MKKKDFKNLIQYHYYGDKFVKRPKYSNRSCYCYSKHLHHSILESDYCNELFILRRAGHIKDFAIQHKIDIVVKGKHITNHYVDFFVKYPDGRVEFHEVKGYEQDLWKIKRRLVEALYPKIPYVVKYDKAKPRGLVSNLQKVYSK